jgi:NAD(P)-dependent dehydrogenase (short-subunit alcohol dehydrogenase family)
VVSEVSTVAVVTGASRGAGAGIARALGMHGCTVYVTGRSEKPGDSVLAGTIHETAADVTAAGGRGIAVRVDHGDDEQVRAFFAQTPEFTGHVIWSLYTDPDVMDVTGRTLIGAELGAKYGIADEGGRQPPSYRALYGVHPPAQFSHNLG